MAASLQNIGPADSGCLHPDQHLSVCGRGDFSLPSREDIRSAESGDLNHGHEIFGGHGYDLGWRRQMFKELATG